MTKCSHNVFTETWGLCSWHYVTHIIKESPNFFNPVFPVLNYIIFFKLRGVQAATVVNPDLQLTLVLLFLSYMNLTSEELSSFFFFFLSSQHAPGVPRILVGNRLHLAFKRQVPTEQARAYAEKNGMTFFEVSPLCNFNVIESFTELSRIVLMRHGMEKFWRPNRGETHSHDVGMNF